LKRGSTYRVSMRKLGCGREGGWFKLGRRWKENITIVLKEI
jgi:hypothetical protein